jgi:PPM family protein phosphatase
MKLSACGKTDVGIVRSNNEDSLFVSAADGLFIVADGMGGHAAGEIASAMAIRLVCDQLIPRLQSSGTCGELEPLLVEAVHTANRELAQAAGRNPAWKGMGTTLTILLLQAGQAQLVHVGDSRMYRYRNGQLLQFSDDHSLVGDQLRQGLISAAEAKSSSLRNILLQAVGITPELEICRKQLPLAEQDRFLLCSDGLTEMLSDQQIAALCATTPDLNQLCDLLVAEAKAAGGKDNITVVLVQVDRL